MLLLLTARFPLLSLIFLANLGIARAQLTQPAPTSRYVPNAPGPARFKVLALAESGGHHIEFTRAARPWLNKLAEEHHFAVDYITNTAPVTAEFLAKYRLVLQLDFVPYGWKPEAMAAFKTYIEEGRGGWVGLHHATLLGRFDNREMWPWFWQFMGKIKFQNYIPNFASATVRVDDPAHPCMRDVPASFSISEEEWYTMTTALDPMCACWPVWMSPPIPRLRCLRWEITRSSGRTRVCAPVMSIYSWVTARGSWRTRLYHILRNAILWASGDNTSSK